MIIEKGQFNNALISIALLDGTSGQIGVSVEFTSNEKLVNIDDSIIKGAFGFDEKCNKGTEYPSGFYWNRESTPNNELKIRWSFMFETLNGMKVFQKYQFLYCIFKGIDKINESIK